MSTQTTAAANKKEPVHTTFQPHMTDPALCAVPRLVGEAYRYPASMTSRERLYIYASVFAKAPQRALEIGVWKGHSSRIIDAALQDLGGDRKLISIDPVPNLEFDWDETFRGRAVFLEKGSPNALPEAMDIAGGPFEFVFLDACHWYDWVRNDLRGIVGVTEPGAMIILHDAYYEPLQRAVRDALTDEQLPFTDCGIVCTTNNSGTEDGEEVSYCGLHLLIRR